MRGDHRMIGDTRSNMARVQDFEDRVYHHTSVILMSEQVEAKD